MSIDWSFGIKAKSINEITTKQLKQTLKWAKKELKEWTKFVFDLESEIKRRKK